MLVSRSVIQRYDWLTGSTLIYNIHIHVGKGVQGHLYTSATFFFLSQFVYLLYYIHRRQICINSGKSKDIISKFILFHFIFKVCLKDKYHFYDKKNLLGWGSEYHKQNLVCVLKWIKTHSL